MRHNTRRCATGLLLVVAMLAALPTFGEVRVVRDRSGEYQTTQVLTSGQTPGVWTPVVRGAGRDVLNRYGDLRGDLPPTIVEGSSDAGYPWAVWSRKNEGRFDLAWSRWTPVGWSSTAWVDSVGESVGDSLDPDLRFDVDGRPYAVWWRDEGGHGQVYLSVFLQSTWMAAYRVSPEELDSRFPSLTIGLAGELFVAFDTPTGRVEQTVWFDGPVTITDDIDPLDVMSSGSLIDADEVH